MNPRGLVDRTVPVLRIDTAEGKLRVVLFGYACHNTTLTQTNYLLCGYFPTARVLKEGGYECRGLYTTQGFFAPAAQDVLVTKVRELAQRAGRKLPE